MMNSGVSVNVSSLPSHAADPVGAFAREIIPSLHTQIESIAVTGSCLTEDFIPGISDINSVFVLREISLPVLDTLASMGKRYGKKRISAPLIMTQEYIHRSLDVFPIEFLDIKLIHSTIYGDEMFTQLEIAKSMLRLQCERDLKAKLINLRQGYIACAGKKRDLAELINNAYPGFFPLFRAMLYMVQINTSPAIRKADVLSDMESTFDMPLDVLKEIDSIRRKRRGSLSLEQVRRIFNEVYRITHEFSLKMDKLSL